MQFGAVFGRVTAARGAVLIEDCCDWGNVRSRILIDGVNFFLFFLSGFGKGMRALHVTSGIVPLRK